MEFKRVFLSRNLELAIGAARGATEVQAEAERAGSFVQSIAFGLWYLLGWELGNPMLQVGKEMDRPIRARASAILADPRCEAVLRLGELVDRWNAEVARAQSAEDQYNTSTEGLASWNTVACQAEHHFSALNALAVELDESFENNASLGCEALDRAKLIWGLQLVDGAASSSRRTLDDALRVVRL
jgi:hypothetical protein